MDTRRFGRTGHMSTVAIFGAFALSSINQELADEIMEEVIAADINHIDVAPSYGKAEQRLAPWMVRERDRFFLGCKTMERDKEGAATELRQSLERLQVDHFDLYQIHAVTNMEELDEATRPGGALDAIIEAREEGLTRFVGITGHGMEVPAVFMEALDRFDFDSVLLPVNFILYANAIYREQTEALLARCADEDVGVMAIKAVAKGPYGDREPTHNTWYEPFTDPEMIQHAVNFTLSQQVTGLCTPGDGRLLSPVLAACENFLALDGIQADSLIAAGANYQSIFS